MRLLQLEYFLKVARLGNVNAAANELNVSQSSVSRVIHRLEDSLGFPLFERVGRNVRLNEYGRIFYQHAERSLQELEDGKRTVEELISGTSRQISFSVPVPRLTHRPLTSYAIDHPDVRIRQRCIPDTKELKTLLEQGELDFALSYEPLKDANYKWDRLLLEHFYFIVNKDHPLAKRKSISLKELDGVRIAMIESDNPEKILDSCRMLGASPDIVFCGNEIIGLGMLIEKGIGGAFISAYAEYEREMEAEIILKEMKKRVSVLRIEEEWFQRELGMISPKFRYMPLASRELCSYMKQYYKKIAPDLQNLGL